MTARCLAPGLGRAVTGIRRHCRRSLPLLGGNQVGVDKSFERFLGHANRPACLDEIQVLPFQEPVAQRAWL